MIDSAEREKLLTSGPPGPVMVHSDALMSRAHVPRSRDRSQLLAAHIEAIHDISGSRAVWMPAFNYDFCRGRAFDVRSAPSQVGPISETFRLSTATWRTPVPVFSLAGTGDPPAAVPMAETEIDPFGPESAFASLCDREGILVWYGAALDSTTFIHFVERLLGEVPYRYDKYFLGRVVTDRGQTCVKLRYHVRPRGHHLDYDWGRLLAQASRDGVIQNANPSANLMWSSAASLRDYWKDLLEQDPLALLDEPSRTWVEPHLDLLGRGFKLTDFET